jgi:hypothetical protein
MRKRELRAFQKTVWQRRRSKISRIARIYNGEPGREYGSAKQRRDIFRMAIVVTS